MVERRKFERYEMTVPATVETLARGARRKKLTLGTVNVCAGGAYFRTHSVLAEGTKVRIEMILNHRRKLTGTKAAHIRILGTVLRSREDGMAIGFSEEYTIAPMPD